MEGEVASVPLPGDSKGRWVWGADSGGKYTVQSGYKALTNTQVMHGNLHFKSLWLRQVPPKVHAFAWKLIQDCLPTLVNLEARGVVPQSDNLCFFL